MTALHFAVESKNERCVALLLNQGASVCVHSKNEVWKQGSMFHKITG